MLMNRLEELHYPELQTAVIAIVDTIARSVREGHAVTNHDVSVTLPVREGQALIISVRAATTCPERSPKTSARGLDTRQLRLVNAAIREKIAEPLSVSALSAVAGLSRSHFSHAFRTSVGRTPHAHIVRLRVEHAMKLMLETDVSMSEVALATGFSDQAHFSNQFRRMAGVTPTQWRRSNRHNEHESPSEDTFVQSERDALR
jgi:transcriptional regulator GlxA family with amidase domain